MTELIKDFSIVCDRRNNFEEDIQNDKMNVDIHITYYDIDYSVREFIDMWMKIIKEDDKNENSI